MTGINNQTVTNAKLCLYNVDGANEGGDFYAVSDDSWQEETVTWNNAPAADTTLLGSLGDVNIDTWYEVDLTSLITADGTYSLRVSDSVGGADYSSKEGSNAPKLLVALGGATPQSCAPAATATPTPGGPTNTPTNTATPGPSPTPSVTPTATTTNPPPANFNNATFVYDGDGKRVKSIFNGTTTTYFVGNHYEVTGSTITKYYYAGTQRIAMRTNGTLRYILGDHLGSTSLTTDANGQNSTKTYYKAWGEVRYASGNTPTKYQYTGQFSYESDFGLYFYNARWYDPYLSRFAQADTIIPPMQGVQAWDRFAYANNSPVKYSDPSGHKVTCEVDENCEQSQRLAKFTGTTYWKLLIKDEFGIKMSEESDYNNTNAKTWDIKNLMTIFDALSQINVALNGKLKSLVGGAIFKWGEHNPNGGNTAYNGLTYGTTISFFTIGNAAIRKMNIFHEFGHLMDNSPGMINVFSRDPGINNPDFLTDDGYLDRSALIDRSQDMYQHPMSIYTDDRIIAQQEHWGDIFASYVAGNINLASTEGQAMNTFITGVLAPYIGTP